MARWGRTDPSADDRRDMLRLALSAVASGYLSHIALDPRRPAWTPCWNLSMNMGGPCPDYTYRTTDVDPRSRKRQASTAHVDHHLNCPTMKPKVLVLRTAGTNCDGETAHAFALAGAEPVRVHVNRLLDRPGLLHEHQLLAVPGGFSYGDDIAAGRILANQLTSRLRDELHAFVAAGKPVIGVCNGFQVLVKTDLLPGPVHY